MNEGIIKRLRDDIDHYEAVEARERASRHELNSEYYLGMTHGLRRAIEYLSEPPPDTSKQVNGEPVDPDNEGYPGHGAL